MTKLTIIRIFQTVVNIVRHHSVQVSLTNRLCEALLSLVDKFGVWMDHSEVNVEQSLLLFYVCCLTSLSK